MEYRTIHFKHGGEVWETTYEIEKSSVFPLIHWFKVFLSDKPCACPNPELAYLEDLKKRSPP